MKRFSILVTLIVVIAGCASAPKYENKAQPNDARVRFETGTRGQIAMGGLTVGPLKLDGQKIKWEDNQDVFVRPGKHEFELFVGGIHIFQKQGNEFLDFDLEPQHRYTVGAAEKDGNFVITVTDVTDPNKPTVIKTTKVKGARPRILPLVIPVK